METRETPNDQPDRFALLEIAWGDVEQADAQLKKDDTQWGRRAFVRAVFASVEATIFLIKYTALKDAETGHFSAAEMAMLREESYSIDSRGNSVVQAKHLAMDANFLFALRMYARPYIPDFSIDIGGSGWQDFRAAIKIRHRITYPKDHNMMEISDDEVRIVRRSYICFQHAYMATGRAVNEALRARSEELAAMLGHSQSGQV